jgi:hypothetical protein
MTSIDEAREAIYQRWNTEWASRTPWTFQNEKFTEPESSTWVRISVQNVPAPTATLGGKNARRVRRFGKINIQIFAPKEGGMAQSGTHAQFALDIFEGEQFDGVDCNYGVINELPEEDKWQPTLVEIDFDYEETK